MSDTLNKIIKVIRDTTGYNWKIARESDMVEDLNFDSLDQIEILMDLERALNVEIADDDAMKWKTIGDIESYFLEFDGQTVH